ncbi:MAG: ATP-binding protein [Acidobacteriota bacterium]|nr:ATP-binding protein [Blastocatellia bacterium]MDW8411322.1 ATP-binding protein [Acidobacteriota bacterium]
MKTGQINEAVALVLAIALITILHYATSISSEGLGLLHEISQRLYYIPIVYASYRYGLKGGIIYALLSAAVHLIHVSEHLAQYRVTALNHYAEASMFVTVAALVGYYADVEKHLQESYRRTSAELEKTNLHLRETMQLLLRAERLKSLGELSAAIAHEIRNPLGAIKGAIEILSPEIPATSNKREFVEIIERETERLNRLVTDFLKYARPRPPERLLTDLNELVLSTINFLSTEAKKRQIKVKTYLTPEPVLVSIDAEQIKQVLVNLLLNAFQASSSGSNVEIQSSSNPTFAKIEIRDYGCGIPSELRERVFDPFFTTKPDGCGLGLSIAYQLIKQNDGELTLESLAQGTLATLTLPTGKT